MPVLLQVHIRSVIVHEARVRRIAQILMKQVGEPSSELGLCLIGDRRMRRLNREFRGKDRTTDVLAFAMRDSRAPHASRFTARMLGDVVISVPTAMRQAREEQRSLEEELTTLLIHGLLHLCGYDHERNKAEARRMQRRERLMRRRLGRVQGLVRLASKR